MADQWTDWENKGSCTLVGEVALQHSSRHVGLRTTQWVDGVETVTISNIDLHATPGKKEKKRICSPSQHVKGYTVILLRQSVFSTLNRFDGFSLSYIKYGRAHCLFNIFFLINEQHVLNPIYIYIDMMKFWLDSWCLRPSGHKGRAHPCRKWWGNMK